MTNDEFIRNLIAIKARKISYRKTDLDMLRLIEFSLSFKNELITIMSRESMHIFNTSKPSCSFYLVDGHYNPITNETFDIVVDYFSLKEETLENLKREMFNELRTQKIKQLNEI